MSIAWYALWFIVAVSLLVTVHEFGHFWVARRLGFKVLRFSVGFGKPIIERTGKDGTVYSLASLPLGGYVKLLDEREGPVPTAELSRSFTRRPPWQRILVLLAGPAFNIIFAILVLWGMLWAAGDIKDVRPVVGDVVKDSIAARAGLHPGDEILSIGAPPSGNHTLVRRDVVFSLLDSISADGAATLYVRSKDGDIHTATLNVGGSEARRKLTEPAALFKGLGFEFWEPPIPAVIGQVIPDGPAAKAGLRKGDEIVAIAGKPVTDFRDLVAATAGTQPGDVLAVRYKRGSEEHDIRIHVGSIKNPEGKTVGFIGVKPAPPKIPESMIVRTHLTPATALTAASQEAWDMTVLQARLVWRMMMGQVSLKNLSGPLSIAEFAGESASDGVTPFLSFLVLISLSLGFLNLLPIPILDGGQVVFQLVEWLKGSPLSERAQAFGQQVGIALLILLMGVALFNDIARQIGG
ncbi:MAG TPA: RIP metalloprotease RseP [Steroidobacteraceae bacterium]|jgi:regulator of sigma E protease|nr:RIP metalloprotease RseP [Steroidobacteraceae bacterium]